MIDPDDNEEKNWFLVFLKFMYFYWRGIVLIVWPCISAVVFLISFEEKIRCLYVLVLMAGYWVTECVPLYVTGLIPVILFPLLGVQDTGDVCVNYMNKINMMFTASLLMGIGIEHCGLHKRIAYAIILGVGCSPRRLHFGFTAVTSLLSMWLMNSATTVMICPIIGAVLTELETEGISSMYQPRKSSDALDEPPRPSNITIAYFLSAAYASSIGGIGTLVGTDSNLVFKGVYETRFPQGNKIDFVPWMLFNVPLMVMMNVFCWFSLEWIFMGLFRPNSVEAKIIEEGTIHQDAAYNVMKSKMLELGKISWNEICVLVLFVGCILMWFFRKPQLFLGWGDFYKTDVADATPAVLVVFLFTALPASFAFFDYCTKDKSARPIAISIPVVPWKVLQEKMPWGLVFLLGGGCALSGGGNKSGMSFYLGEKLSAMNNLPSFLVLCITSGIASIVTEITANVTCSNILSPVLIEMSMAMKVNPIEYTFPAVVMCSMAYLMPVGTPVNAIVAGFANIRTIDMIKGGILLKIFAWAIYMLLYPSYGRLFYDQGNVPDWLNDNSTSRTV